MGKAGLSPEGADERDTLQTFSHVRLTGDRYNSPQPKGLIWKTLFHQQELNYLTIILIKTF